MGFGERRDGVGEGGGEVVGVDLLIGKPLGHTPVNMAAGVFT